MYLHGRAAATDGRESRQYPRRRRSQPGRTLAGHPGGSTASAQQTPEGAQTGESHCACALHPDLVFSPGAES